MFQKFAEDQAKKFMEGLRQKFEQFLTVNDEDGNGVGDKAQLLADFDKITETLPQLIGAVADLGGLAAAYYRKYAPKAVVAEAPAAAEGGEVA